MKEKYILPFVIIFSLQSHIIGQVQGTNQEIIEAISKQGKAFVKDKKINAVSIGVYKSGERYTQHFGELEKGKGNIPTDETIYEIASVTKTMTGYLVARAVLDKKIELANPVANYLEGDHSNLSFNNIPITIEHLLTHTSGLPMFLPNSMNGLFETGASDVPQRYFELEKSYNKPRFLADLKLIILNEAPGMTYSYSNAGAELIGYILEKVYDKSIDELYRESFLEKQGMHNTAIRIDTIQQKKLVRGYWMDNKALSPNQLNVLWATGSGVKTNMNDMLSYIALQLNAEDPVVIESQKSLYTIKNPLQIGYFWRIWKDKYGTSYNHHGGTSGMQNWLFIYPKYDLGISIMTNQSDTKTPNKLSNLAKKLLKAITNE